MSVETVTKEQESDSSMNEKPDAPNAIAELSLNPRKKWRLVLISAIYLLAFIIFDLLSRQFQELRGVVAWYPPAGLTYALLLVFGRKHIPVVTIALFFSSIFIYRMPQPPYLLVLWAIVISLIYGGAGAFMHHRIHIDWQLRKFRDVVWFIFTVIVVSALLAILSVSSSAMSSDMPRSEIIRAMVFWWIGETVGVLTVAPFLLIFLMPGLKRFSMGQSAGRPTLRSFPPPTLTGIGQAASIVLTLYLVFGTPLLNEYHPLYLISLPLIWIALKRGFKGVSAAILALNLGVVLALWFFQFDLSRLGELELWMIVNCIVGLLVGAIVTDSKLAEESRLESEERFRSLYENATIGMYRTTPDGIILMANPVLVKMLGYESFEELSKRDLAAEGFGPGDSRQKFQERIEEEGEVRGFESAWKHKNGSIIYVRESTHLVRNKTGQPLYYEGTVEDITERKQAEEKLLDSEVRYRALIENNSDAIALINAEGKIIYRSPAAFHLMGLDPSKPNSDSMLDAVHPDDKKDAEERFIQILKAPGTSIPFRYRVRHVDGSWRWVEGTGNNLLEEPSVNAIVTNYRDVTERKQTESERQALLEIMQGMSATESLNDLLELIRQSLAKVIYAENFFVVFHNAKTGLFEEVYGIDKYDPPMPPSKLEKSIVSYVFRTGEPLLLTEAKFKELEALGELELVGTHTASWLGAPLKTLTKTIGVLAVQSYENPDCYTERDKAFLSSVSAQVAVAIERKLAEESIQKSEKRFRALVENSLEEISLIDSEGTLTWESPTTRRPLGYPTNSFVGGTLIELIHPDEQQEAADLLGQVIKTPGTIKEGVFRLRHRDGSYRWMEAVITNLLDEPAVQSVVINYRDITERKQREEEIRFRTEELTMLYLLSRGLADAKTLEEVIALVNRHAVESVHTTFACMALMEGGELVAQGVHPVRNLEHDFILGERQAITDLPLCQRVMDHNEPVILKTDTLEAGISERAILMLDFAQSVCLVPLWVGDTAQHFNQAIGLLILGEAREDKREPFTTEKIHLARSIGDQAAAAIRRLLLLEQAERRLQQLASMSEIDRTIASNFDVRISLQIILKHVIEQLRVNAADVLVYNNRTQSLEFTAGTGYRSRNLESMRQPMSKGQAGRALMERQIVKIPEVATSGAVFANPEFIKAENVAAYFAVPLITKGQIMGVLELCHRNPLHPNEEWFDFLMTLAGQAAIAIDNVRMFESLQRSTDELELAYDATIEGWSHALDLRDKETEGHTQRVTETTMNLARTFGLSETELINVRWGALLHDIGKMGVPDSILLKPGSLTENEWVVMKRHPELAYEMLLPIRYLHGALDIPYCHHEWWDGSGYPRGLKGKDIPLVARIFAVVDVWDALISDRPYRQAWSEEKARGHIQGEAGKHFDPDVIKAFFANPG